MAGIVLAIAGLASASPVFGATAAVVVGAGFLFEVWSVAPREHARGVWAERLAGFVGIVFGILSLLHLAPRVLAPIGIIVFGVGLAAGMGMLSRTGRIIAGVCAIALGVIALTQFDPRTFTLIGLIAVAGTLMLTGPAVTLRGHGARAPAV
jgi:hypothetical protein